MKEPNSPPLSGYILDTAGNPRDNGDYWRSMDLAPKGVPILGWCVYEADPYTEDGGNSLTKFGAHAEALSSVINGPNVIVWGGGGGWMPDWRFLYGSEFEIVANPIAWAPIPRYSYKSKLYDE